MDVSLVQFYIVAFVVTILAFLYTSWAVKIF